MWLKPEHYSRNNHAKIGFPKVSIDFIGYMSINDHICFYLIDICSWFIQINKHYDNQHWTEADTGYIPLKLKKKSLTTEPKI